MYPPSSRISRASKGFTIIELSVTIAIIAILMAMVIAGIGNVKERSASVRCASMVRQWGQAFTLFAAENGGTLPTYPSSSATWQDGIAPYLVSLQGYYISYPRFALRMQMHCPKNTEIGWAYGTNRNLLAAYNSSPPKNLASIPRPSSFLIIAETDNDGVTTTEDNLNNGINYKRHRTGSNIGFADGHVEFLSSKDAASRVTIQTN